MMDKYDDAVAHLTARPGQIEDAWNHPYEHEAGCLFGYCCRSDEWDPNIVAKALGTDGFVTCGCLTQVRRSKTRSAPYVAGTADLTREIQDDDRIPDAPSHISVEDLPVFAEWQRRLDKELGRYNGS